MAPERTRSRRDALLYPSRCGWCNQSFSNRGIANHRRACRERPTVLESGAVETRDATHSSGDEMESEDDTEDFGNAEPGVQLAGGFITEETMGHIELSALDVEAETANIPSSPAPNMPHFIYEYHPSSNIPPSIVYFNGEDTVESTSPLDSKDNAWSHVHQSICPWFPFKTYADFDFCHQVITDRLSRKTINDILLKMHKKDGWTLNGSAVSFRNYAQMEKVLRTARLFFPEFQLASAEVKVMGETVKFQFYWRDPWEWIQTLVTDPSLASEIRWYPRRKFYHDGQRRTRIYDDVDSGDLWWRVQSQISSQFIERTPHCYLPLHYWSDKGKVSARVKKHPVVLRPCFLPRGIRNGSGNGGGVIIALLPVSTHTLLWILKLLTVSLSEAQANESGKGPADLEQQDRRSYSK
ncbi:hypothetical protein SISSUDRAFT_1067699 [Sistotremastrum suecicum HHB10207 ss-3]|uniref:Uncharacterized protein n=1 Tax=Sistotremastrum suecicum HHB10207 ss-3 TaxID=1314776 RepID=A0A165WTJ8_9AGAM|nr:hypothetical protein SISSUDRAFT_1067699 [Sistotremastrum suecicum HHB10207 ss-3]